MATKLTPQRYDAQAWALIARFYQGAPWLAGVRIVLDHRLWPPTGNMAMTWGTTIYIARYLAEPPYTTFDRALNLAHELAHVEQYRRWGKLGFGLRWLWQVASRAGRLTAVEHPELLHLPRSFKPILDQRLPGAQYGQHRDVPRGDPQHEKDTHRDDYQGGDKQENAPKKIGSHLLLPQSFTVPDTSRPAPRGCLNPRKRRHLNTPTDARHPRRWKR